jgi:hypothetical protein
MPSDPQYNVDEELYNFLEITYGILEALEDIRLVLEIQQEITLIDSPPFDPLKTFGKYC